MTPIIARRIDGEVPAGGSGAAEAAPGFIARLDGAYRRLTVDDGAAALGAALGLRRSVLAEREGWGRRRPVEIPWGSGPGGRH
ncbi:hypothetical protein [Kitasatospora sp. NPDC090308]|uniref:hypothetical protein n=1 Tax=Kitasatospora sp. NPDC090308 TaxID=3364082 RepID=UPI00380C36F6